MIQKLILLGCGLFLSFFVVTNAKSFTTKYDANYWLDQYQHSQYYQGDKSSFILSDADTDAIRGYQLVGQKTDPVHVLPGHPFLGTYIIGLSILIFGNQNITALLAGIVCLIAIYKIILQFTTNKTVASLGVALLLTEPLFREQLLTSMLDIYLLMFSLISVFFYIKWLKQDKILHIIISQLFMGFAIATKFFPAIFPLLGAYFLIVLLTGNFKRFISFVLSLCVAIVGFLLGHISYFYFHPNFIEFARFERYIISWWAGTTQVAPGGVWDLIFRNRWHTWWGNFEVTSVNTWWFGWPIFLVLAIYFLARLALKHRLNLSYMLFTVWVAASLVFDSFQAVYPRHLLPVITAIYVMVLVGFTSLNNINKLK